MWRPANSLDLAPESSNVFMRIDPSGCAPNHTGDIRISPFADAVAIFATGGMPSNSLRSFSLSGGICTKNRL